jgi:hypothetical protein
MRAYLLAGAASLALVVGALAFCAPAQAALLSLGPDAATEGLTYTLESQATADPLTELFALTISGENTALDTRGGRTGINAVALNTVSKNNPSSGAFVGTLINGNVTLGSAGFTFVPGGLASSGCDGSGGFFCFDNTAIPPIPLSPLITGPVTLVFSATLTTGTWAGYTTALKIDWVGSEKNYSLVSEEIPVNTTCPDCQITPVIVDTPEPMTLAVLGVGLLGLGVVRRRAT